MSFDKDYPNRKDIRKPYRKSKKYCRSCRNHGSCDYCEGGRLYNSIKKIQSASEQIKEYEFEEDK